MSQPRTDRESLLQWLQPGAIVPVDTKTVRILLDALRERLAQPEQEPVALKETMQKAVVLLKTVAAGLESAIAKTIAPPQRKPLTDEHIDSRAEQSDSYASFHAGVRFAEAAHGIKGEA